MQTYVEFTQIAFPILSILVVVLGWRAQRKSDMLKIAQTQLSQMRSEAYAGVYSLFFDILRDVKSEENKLNSHELGQRLMKIKETVLSYGSDEVVLSLSNWLVHASNREAKHPHDQMIVLGQLLLAIRRDMGYKDTKLSSR